MASCVLCGRGFHKECAKCLAVGKGRCHIQKKELSNEPNREASSLEPVSRKSARGNLRDPKSTGRKRAAELYPLDRNSPCEWRSQRNCGGGLRPIIGCFDGTQKHRHHGPVKDTTRNELGNVHRICNNCHVHWHELNDLIYDERQFNLLPHQPTPADLKDIIQNALDWKSGVMGKRFELASSKNREKYVTRTSVPSPDDSTQESGDIPPVPESVDNEN